MRYFTLGQSRNVFANHADLATARHYAKQEANQTGHRVYVKSQNGTVSGKTRTVATVHPDPEFQNEQYYGPRTKHTHKGYNIKPKLDFGFQPHLIDGKLAMTGFVVTDAKDLCNVMPGATWFQTVERAKEAIDILLECGGNPNIWDAQCNHEEFWKMIRQNRSASKQAATLGVTSADEGNAPSPTSTSP